MTDDLDRVLSHGLFGGGGGGFPLLDPSVVKVGVDRGDGTLGEFTGETIILRLEDTGISLS